MNRKALPNMNIKRIWALSALFVLFTVAIAFAARTSLTPLTADVSSVPAIATFSWTAADVSNGNSFIMTASKNMILVRNTNTGSTARNFTITTAASGTLKYTLAAGAYARIGPLPSSGYAQVSDANSLWFNGDHAELEFAIVNVP